MTAAHCREEARRLLEGPACAAVLPARAGLLWRTHDGGLLAFQEDRLEEGLRASLRRLLGHGRQRAPERAACPVRLLYALGAGGVRLAASAEEPGSLPGGGVVLRAGEHLVCLSSEPRACLEALAQAEERGRERLLSRLLDSAPAAAEEPAAPASTSTHSCGRCAERAAGLLGEAGCLGSCCVNHGPA
ncbi:MAG: hypothetical protein WC326_11710 [Candidatus Delongbacteria bacterium]